jgi:putative ABC transport system substrate-binding protein
LGARPIRPAPKIYATILTETVPKATRIAIIWNTNDQGMTQRYQAIEKAAQILKVEVQALGVTGPDDFAGAFSIMTQRRPDALFVVADSLSTENRKIIIEFAASNRIPAMYEFSSNVRDGGGLMSYGPSPTSQFQRAAYYVDRILKGAKPADLPVEQPTRYELVINLKTAKALGLTVPQSVLILAEDVIQ